MDLGKLFNDDDAVSPVIGVILMVAITVILAAVIASFVLGLGDQNNPAPTANFDFDYSGSGGGPVEITFADGDELEAANVYVRGESLDSTDTGQWDQSSPGPDGDADGSGVIRAGMTATAQAIGDDWVANVVWEDPDSDSTSTLSTDSGPDA